MEFKLNEDQQLMKDMFVEFTEQFVKPIAAESGISLLNFLSMHFYK